MLRIGTQKIKDLNQFHHGKNSKKTPNGCKTYDLNKKSNLGIIGWLHHKTFKSI